MYQSYFLLLKKAFHSLNIGFEDILKMTFQSKMMKAMQMMTKVAGVEAAVVENNNYWY
jgi:hypothetical protein